MSKKFLLPLMAAIIVLALLVTGCPDPDPVDPVDPVDPDPTHGTWVGEVVFVKNDQVGSVISQLAAGTLDMYAFPIAEATPYQQILDNPEIQAELNYGGYRELRFNTYRQGPDPSEFTFDTGKLNPFADWKVREAMHYAIDRNYIYEEILQEMGAPKYTALGTEFPDHSLYFDIIGPLQTQYGYNLQAAKDVLDVQMPLMGATWDTVGEFTGWVFDGEPVEVILLIRSDLPPNPAQGMYVATQMEALGFEATRLQRTGTEAAPLWQTETGVRNGSFHIYTGGWSSPAIPRDGASIFRQMYTEMIMPLFLWTILADNLAEDGFADFRQACIDLGLRNFSSMTERRDLFEKVLVEAMQFNNVLWTVDTAGANAFRVDIATAVDRAGGIGDPAWVHTTHRIDPATGDPVWADRIRVAVPNILLNPWNPVEGSPFTYDMFVTRRAMGDTGTLPDPRDGLYYPLRVESATVTYDSSLPITKSTDWITELTPHTGKIAVPDAAWYDWDAVAGEWITAGEHKAANPEWEQTANVKTVAVYPVGMLVDGHENNIPLHDGSSLSLADFLMAMIVYYERGKADSLIFDASKASGVNSFLTTHKGHMITSLDPLTIETYTNTWYMDAEWNVSTWFPTYGTYGWTGFWHMVTAGWLVEHNPRLTGFPGDVAFHAWSKAKSDDAGTPHNEWMDYTKGASLAELAKATTWAKANDFMPYGDYIADLYGVLGAAGAGLADLEGEIAERWTNLQAFANPATGPGHYWVGNGPYYLHRVELVGTVTLRKFEDYPDEAGRFFWFLDPLP